MDGKVLSLAGVDLNLLLALDALLQERSVTRAGARLSLSQSSMSGALARLRLLFDDDLLLREGRSMRLTPRAETLREPTRQIIAQIEAMVTSRTSFDPRQHSRSFVVLATDYAALVLMREVMRILAVEAPGVRLRLESPGLLDHSALLRAGEIDLAIIPAGATAHTGLPWVPVLHDRFVAAVWRENVGVTDPLTMERFRTLPYLSYRVGQQVTVVDRVMEQIGQPRQPDAVVESFVLGALLLRGTRQVTFLQERLARELESAAELRLLQPPFEIPPLVETMSWHPRANPCIGPVAVISAATGDQCLRRGRGQHVPFWNHVRALHGSGPAGSKT